MNFPATEQLKRALAHISNREADVHAFAFLAEEDASRQANAFDQLDEAARGTLPLFGLPVGIKDVIHVAGMPTAAGTRILQGFEALEDASCVSRLRRAGALIIGKTATTEFAFFDPAATRNPRLLTHTPGGSSSGSAAAVAAGFCPAAIGTQTFGSVIRPAAYCGVIGFKPTYGAIPTDGVIPLSWSLDHVGVFSVTVELAAQLLDVLLDEDYAAERPARVGGEGSAEQEAKLGEIVVGIPDRFFTEGVESAVEQGTLAGLEALQFAGARIRTVSLPPLFEPAVTAAQIILHVEAATFHRKWFPERARDYGAKLRAVVESGQSISGVEYVRARQVCRDAQEQMQSVWQQVDFLVTPSAPTTAPEGLAWTGDPVFNTPFSVLGNPAVSLPSHYSEKGLPVGCQIVGPWWSETKLLRLALRLERMGFGRVVAIEETRSVHAN